MNRGTLIRYRSLRMAAAVAGLALRESGAPRGERRYYHLCRADGTLFVESTDLGVIGRYEARLGCRSAVLDASKL